MNKNNLMKDFSREIEIKWLLGVLNLTEILLFFSLQIGSY